MNKDNRKIKLILSLFIILMMGITIVITSEVWNTLTEENCDSESYDDDTEQEMRYMIFHDKIYVY